MSDDTVILDPPIPSGEYTRIDIVDEMKASYLDYAMSVIVARALPDVRDGLKPVHRRILFASQEGGMVAGRPYRKSAKIVGDVMGAFHPHGDQAIYEALVRLAQDFATRYPLVDGQGNFGNIDGDSAAAYRYTEARMTEVARLLLDGIDEDATSARPTTTAAASRWSCPGRSPIFWPMARPALRSAWRPASRRTTLPSSAMPRCTSSSTPTPASTR